MWAIRSAFGFFVQTPFGPRKSGMPLSVEMPAPVRTATARASSTHRATSSTELLVTGLTVPAAIRQRLTTMYRARTG